MNHPRALNRMYWGDTWPEWLSFVSTLLLRLPLVLRHDFPDQVRYLLKTGEILS